MQDTKAIRPEIKGLFDTIRQQAVRYAEAFELLETHRLEYRQYIDELKKLNEEVYTTTSNEIFNVKQKFDDLTKVLKIESTKVTQKYSELKDLKQLQDSYFSALESIKIIQTSLEQQFNLLKKGLEEFHENTEQIRGAADEKVDVFINSSLERIDEIVKKQYQKFEDKIVNKVRLIEGKIVNNDEVYWNFTNKYKEDIKKVLEEFDDFKNAYIKIETSKRELGIPSVLSSSGATSSEISERIDELAARISDLNLRISNQKPLKSSGDTRITSSSSKIDPTIYEKLSANEAAIHNLKNANTALSQKVSKLSTIAIVSTITAIISIILNFVL